MDTTNAPDVRGISITAEGELAGSALFVENVTKEAGEIHVSSRADMATAATAMKRIRDAIKVGKSRWDEIFGPLDRHLRGLRKMAKENYFDPLDRAYAKLADKCVAYETDERLRVEREASERVAAEKQRAEKAAMLAAAGATPEIVRDHAAPANLPAPVLHVGPVRANGGAGVTVVQEPYVIVTDKTAIPVRFVEVNERAILAAWHSGEKDIPGVTIALRMKARGLS